MADPQSDHEPATEKAQPVEHLPAPTNPGIRLHQEYTMRTGGYDELARVESHRRGWTTFHSLVEELGLDGAIRDIKTCAWLSESDWRRADFGGPCMACEEVAHA